MLTAEDVNEPRWANTTRSGMFAQIPELILAGIVPHSSAEPHECAAQGSVETNDSTKSCRAQANYLVDGVLRNLLGGL